MTTTTPPAASEALVFYTAACPLVERLLAMARRWRDNEPSNPEAIRAHSEFVWLAIRCDLRLARSRQHDLTADHTTGAGRARRTTTPGGGAPDGCQ